MKKQPSKTKTEGPLLKVGWWVALTLKPNTAPLRCYVGQIQALSNDGIRLTLLDVLSGEAAGYDVYVPHRNIESALVATDEHRLANFAKESENWQAAMIRMQGAPVGS